MVVVVTVSVQNATKVIFILDQDLVQTLFANRAHPSFSESIRPWRLIRDVNDLDLF